jgi:general secretion pathway protein F
MLGRLADRLEERTRTLRELAARAAYPLLVLHIAAFTVSIRALPRSTGAFVAQWLLLTLVLDGLLVGLVLLVRWRLASSTSPDRWPVLGRVFRLAHQGEYLETLALLYGSGVPVVESHALAAAAVSRAPIRHALERAEPALRGGQGFVPSLAATGVMDPLVLGMLAAGEATGDLEGAAIRAATLGREEERRELRRAAVLAGALLYATAVAAVAFVVFSFYSSQLSALR